MPGRVLTFIVNDPSLKGGRKLRPNVAKTMREKRNSTPVADRTAYLCSTALCSKTPYTPLSFRATTDS
ncbi:hypothetical protein Barb4_04614 [Bacteroidales bacterium Barb4]|nr:hypothetical protein Barb4_04614 [Bacteroidales bacterium Barb4]